MEKYKLVIIQLDHKLENTLVSTRTCKEFIALPYFYFFKVYHFVIVFNATFLRKMLSNTSKSIPE